MSYADCECCEGSGGIDCPTLNWITLHKWKGNFTVPNDLRLIHSTTFRFRLTFNSITADTGPISANSTSYEIKSALEALSNIGPGLTVTLANSSSPSAVLPLDKIWIEFSSSLTALQDVPLLEILDNSEGWKVQMVRRGVGENCIQEFSRRPGSWDAIELDRYPGAVWQWKIVAIGTSAQVPDLTRICVQQNRRDWKTFISPIRTAAGTFFGLTFRKLKWPDSTITGTVTGGTFDLNLTIGGDVETYTFPHDVVASQILTSIQTHPQIANAGIVTVTGGPLPLTEIVLGFVDAVDKVKITCLSNLIVTPRPTPITRTVTTVSTVPTSQTTEFDYDFPVTGGSFIIKVVNSAGTETQQTAPIPYSADAADIVAELASIDLLHAVSPIVTFQENNGQPPTVIPPDSGNDESQRFFINDVKVIGGSFKLSLNVNGSTATTGPILYNASTSFILAALRSLPNTLPTDDFRVVKHGQWGFEVTFKGTLGVQDVPAMGFTNNLIALGVEVQSSTGNSDQYNDHRWEIHTRHKLIWKNQLSLAPTITVINSLETIPDVIIRTVGSDTSQEFQNWLEPLNVGTIWSHYIREAWGNADNRRINVYQWAFKEIIQRQIIEPNGPGGGVALGPPSYLPVECGDGFSLNTGCSLYQWTIPDYPTPGEESAIVRMKNSESNAVRHRADFNRANGTIQVTSDGTLNFAFMIRCVGCHHSSEYNLLGVHENNINAYWSQIDTSQPEIYDPFPGISGCATELKYGRMGSGIYGPACRFWQRRFDNVPYSGRITFGPDGFDVHLINKKFVAEGLGNKTRKPPCKPDVVAFCDGYWLQVELSRKYPGIEPRSDKCVKGCSPKPYRDHVEEHPVVNLDRLKMLFGKKFSFWGGWIDIEASLANPSGKIICKFNDLDLSDIKMIILGGLPVRCQHQRYVNVSDPTRMISDTLSSNGAQAGATEHLLYKQWDEISTYQFIAATLPNPGYQPLVHREFEPGTLDPLKRWLAQGNRTLLIDGGVWPTKFLSEMGLTTTMETFAEWADEAQPITPNTLNGSLRFGTLNVAGLNPQPAWYQGNPVWGRNVYLNWTPGQTSPEWLFIKPQPHPFNTSVGGSGITATQHYHHPIDEWKPMYEERNYAPVAGLRHYTTAFPLVNPGSGSTVLAKCQGEIAIHPWYDVVTNSYYSAPVDYPAIVAESYSMNGGFKLSFTHNGTTETTGLIPPNATAVDIKTALSALTNIGGNLTVIGGPLPGSIDITFDSPLTIGLDVAKLIVLETQDIQVQTTQKGGLTKNEIQRITGTMVPSRVVITGACELVGQLEWGHNYRDPSRQVSDFGTPNWGINSHIGQDDLVFCAVQEQPPVASVKVESQYNRNGYGWGKGLTYICQDEFLINLLEKRSVY